MKKILIGTHNHGKFKEIAYLVSKKYKKISPKSLNIPSPKETGKTFSSNSKLKADFFSKFVNFPVISDDSGLCVKSLNNQPGIYSARWAKKYGNFYKAMQYILQKLKNKKDRSATFVCSLSFKKPSGKIITVSGKIKENFIKNNWKKRFWIRSIFLPHNQKITFGQMEHKKKINMDHRFKAFKNLKRKVKIL